MATINGCQSRSRTNLTTAAKVVVSGFTEQMHTTVFAIKDTMIHVHRKLRRTHQDIVNLCKNGQKRKDVRVSIFIHNKINSKNFRSQARSTTNPCYVIASSKTGWTYRKSTLVNIRLRVHKITFLGITMMMISLVLGGITGNIWHDLGCFPQLTVSYALLIIFSLLYRFYHQFKMVPG